LPSCQAPPAVTLEAGVCNGLPLIGDTIVPTCNAGEPPVAQGGTVADGLYVLESIVIYGGTCDMAANTGRVVWLVCGNVWITVDDFPGGPGTDGGLQEKHYDVVASSAGSTLTGQVACSPQGVTGSTSWQYSASSGHFSLVYPNSSGGMESDNFTRLGP
jgi:hypothetical protein